MSHIKERLKQYKTEYSKYSKYDGLYVDDVMDMLEQLQDDLEQDEKESSWIPVTERLPEDGDCRFYMCLVENHIEDVPMMCQFEEEAGFGFYKDIYDPVSLGFVDTEFDTMEELGYEKVICWMPLPEPYRKEDYESN